MSLMRLITYVHTYTNSHLPAYHIWNRTFALFKSKICCSILSVLNPYETLTTYFKLYHVKLFFFLFFFEGTLMMYGFPFPLSSQNCNFIAYHVTLYLAVMTLFLEIAILFLINESIYCIVIRNCNLSYSKTLNLCISQFYFISCNYNIYDYL